MKSGLNKDVLGIIFSFLRLEELIAINNLGDIHINNAMENYSFDFFKQQIPRSITLTQFRNMFPLATGIKISFRHDINDDEFIANILPRYNNKSKRDRILRIDISGCIKLSYLALAPLSGLIHTIDMSFCPNLEKNYELVFFYLSGVRNFM